VRAPLLLLVLAAPAAAQDGREALRERRCTQYMAAWDQALSRFGTAGLSAEFRERHGRFLSSGCRTRVVCPRSAEELRIADAMTAAAMNAGLASTYVPFTCREG
jgi:hypothetical protein